MSRSHRVLLAWEHGKNFGHAARLGSIAAELSSQGAEVSWVVPAHELALPSMVKSAVRRTTSPRVNVAAPRSTRRMHSFADILVELGFADAAALRVAVDEWLELFSRLAVDRVVLDYAPTAQLAALIAGLPSAQVTSGFDAPPPQCPLFGVGMRGPMLEARNSSQVEQVDLALNTVGQQLGRDRDTGIRDLLAYPMRFYDCIPETDPYGPRTDGCYVGPLGELALAPHPTWPEGPADAHRVFVYLRSEPQLRAVLSALPAASYRVLCVMPGAGEQLVSSLRRDGVTLLTSPVDLSVVLPQSDLVVSYGAAATACRALLLGKPQLLLPVEVDKHLIASRIAAIGAGTLLGPRAGVTEMCNSIETLLVTPTCRDAARKVAARYPQGFGALRELCNDFLGNDHWIGATPHK